MATNVENAGAQGVGSPIMGPETEPIWEAAPRPALWIRSLNRAGGALRRFGGRWPRLDPGSMLAEAERRAGLHDWGDRRFREGLHKLVEAFEAQDTAHTFGRFFFREYCVRALVNRLRIENDLKQHPEILDVPIERPLFVTGLPRSGTTLLHRLLCEDPAGRPLWFWETLEPSPPPRPEDRLTDPRLARARQAVARLHALAPSLRAGHDFDADSPEECNNLFAHGFIAGINGFIFDVPDYVRWLEGQDLVEPYRYLRRQLQLLSWRWPGRPWLLKAPAHLYGLDALTTVFPDACIIQTHRDPLQVLPSFCRLAAIFRGIFSERVDLRRLGVESVEGLSKGTRRAVDARARTDPARFFDVSYSSLLADPISQVRRAREFFGYGYDEELEARMKRHLSANPQHKHGVHRYSLEQFGLDPAAVRDEFAPYLHWVAANLSGGF